MRFIDNFKVILLDMGNTFMFECDRFGKNEGYFETYANLGGSNLKWNQIEEIIDNTFSSMLEASRNPDCVEHFASVAEFLRKATDGMNISSEDTKLLETVFALHEVGRIPKSSANALHKLRQTHPLGLVSNIWSKPEVFESELRRAGVLDLFEVFIWSSDYSVIKPSPRLFQLAIDYFSLPPNQMVYIGDHPIRDVAGAKSLGMSAVWIRNNEKPWTPDYPRPDLIVDDLSEVLD